MPEKRRRAEADEKLRFPMFAQPMQPHRPGTVEMILAASEEMLPLWNSDPENERRRLERKSRVRFVLRNDD